MKIDTKISFGIWTVHEDGITCNGPEPPVLHYGRDFISDKLEFKIGLIWDLPYHIATRTWSTERDILNLMQAMAVFRSLYLKDTPTSLFYEMDKRTISFTLGIIENKNKGNAA